MELWCLLSNSNVDSIREDLVMLLLAVVDVVVVVVVGVVDSRLRGAFRFRCCN